ncbi:COX15/CtaA family protein [Rhodothermus profundi]|uniref:Cytochrome c oxidase assembly protein subunit 15 n=1 Tax=Rhodothermus profundi TaxID=633813 RepID=A0A1M6Q430_9BACT|nr:COX15/CtaA family protein [Rhodothermus profundi]SHK14903.1 cytochrome c oxidase assembly protein subunit 15 [Rhodothermus profundi]
MPDKWTIPVYSYRERARGRWWFAVLTAVFTLALISWGGFVTTIDAGMAVPDWPSSFGSYDPFKTGFHDPTDPSAQWWDRTPILAEHGHRLLGALVGLLTIGLALWTWWRDPRRWVRTLGFVALGLVIFQGILGGLRVTENSLTLAAVHGATAQLFFSLIVAIALFTSPAWLEARAIPADSPQLARLRRLALWTIGALYLQIILGVLLRHPGQGIALNFAAVHIAGAFVVTGLVLAVFIHVQKHYESNPLLNRAAWAMLWIVTLQFALGLSAYLVLLYETPAALRSTLQVVLRTAHVATGALLMGSTVVLTLLALRRRANTPASAALPELAATS